MNIFPEGKYYHLRTQIISANIFFKYKWLLKNRHKEETRQPEEKKIRKNRNTEINVYAFSKEIGPKGNIHTHALLVLSS